MIDKKINLWLQEFDIVKKISQYEEVHSESLTDNIKNLALQRTGTEEMPLDYIGEKGWKKQYQYMLLLKSESEEDIQRLNNLDWLDDLSDLLLNANETRDYPILENNKKVVKVSCANAVTYQDSDDGAISVYSLQLYFDIKGGM